MRFRSLLLPLLLLLLCFCVTHPARAQDSTDSTDPANQNKPRPQSYTTISSVTVTPLSNGIQIKFLADGILQYTRSYGQFAGGSGTTPTDGKSYSLSFPDARNGTGKNFINVNRYPVSYVSLTTPQGATNGIGLSVVINGFVPINPQITNTPDNQGVLVTIVSDRTIEGRRGATGDVAAGDGGKPDTSVLVRYENNKLSLRAIKADIHSLIGAIAEKTNLSVAVDDAVERKVSLNLLEAAPEAAIRSIATANGLALSRVGDTFVLSEGVPTDLATYRVSGTESYRMQNTQAATASGLLPNFLYSYVKVNSEQNAVVVTAPSQMLAKIGQDLNKVDIPSPQILIEAVAVEFTDSVDKDFGLLLADTRSTRTLSLDTTSGQISYNSVGKLPQTFGSTLRALVQTGRARVRARPQMAVVNGKTANIFIGAQRFILTQFNSFGQTQTRIQPVDVGVKLAVSPLTGGNGEITTTIAPEVSNITEQDATTGLPVLSTRRADTTVRVKDGETIAIGGLTLNQESVTNRKIPFLGDIPIIGNLFRSQKRNTVQTELVVFITPHILPQGATAPVQTSVPPVAPVGPPTGKKP